MGKFAGEKVSTILAGPADATPPSFSINTTAWTAGSSLLSLGLSVPQAMGCVTGVACITAIVAVLAGWAGSHSHLGFTVLCRAEWGMRGGL